MILYHASPRRNRASIGLRGILTRFAETRWKRVWLHAVSLNRWAIEHVAKRHNVGIDDIDLWAVEVGEIDLRRFSFGVWTVEVDIGADSIQLLPALQAPEAAAWAAIRAAVDELIRDR